MGCGKRTLAEPDRSIMLQQKFCRNPGKPQSLSRQGGAGS
jgi:hypothetical protein